MRVTCNFGEDCGNSQYYTCIYIEDSFLIHTAAAAAAAKSLQSCPTLCDLIDGSPPGSSIHGVFQARVLEGGSIAFSIIHTTMYKLGNQQGPNV